MRSISVISILLLALMMTGCANVQPWVKPYERANLANPVMAFERDPIADAYLDHVYESREGARGATGGAHGGCGCN